MKDTIYLTVNPENIDQAVKTAGEVLKNGGIVAFPTDTVYGLGAVCYNQSAVQSIFAAKERPQTKPLSLLVSGAAQVEKLAESVPEDAYKLMKEYWPGPLTLIFRRNPRAVIADSVTCGSSTIGLRMPDNELTVRIIEAAGTPLAAPSANTSGKRSSTCAEQVREDLSGKVDMILDGGECTVGVSSTVLDVSKEPWKILRQGTVTRQDIEKTIGKTIGE